MSSRSELCLTHFSRGGEKYFKGGFAPAAPHLVTGLSGTHGQ